MCVCPATTCTWPFKGRQSPMFMPNLDLPPDIGDSRNLNGPEYARQTQT